MADSTKRGLVSWDDFVIFQTILKRPDADYWIAFEYFDVYVLLFKDCLYLSILHLRLIWISTSTPTVSDALFTISLGISPSHTLSSFITPAFFISYLRRLLSDR